MQRPLACCAGGWALLSIEKDREIEKIVRRTQAEADKPHWRKTAKQAFTQISHIRRNGHVMSEGQTTEGAGSVAVLLPAAAGRTPLAAAVGGPSQRIIAKRDQILEALSVMATKINEGPVGSFVDNVSA
jgi:DNA-binding IclR family transcriptional regulator